MLANHSTCDGSGASSQIPRRCWINGPICLLRLFIRGVVSSLGPRPHRQRWRLPGTLLQVSVSAENQSDQRIQEKPRAGSVLKVGGGAC